MLLHGYDHGVQVDGAAIGCIENKDVPTEPEALVFTTVYCRLDLAHPIDIVVPRMTRRCARPIPADQSLLARSAMDFKWLVAVVGGDLLPAGVDSSGRDVL